MKLQPQDPLRLASATRRHSKPSAPHVDLRANTTQASNNEQAIFSPAQADQFAQSSLAAHIEPNAFEESFIRALDSTLSNVSSSTLESGVALLNITSLDGQHDADEHILLLGHDDSIQSPPSPESPATIIRIPIKYSLIAGPRPKSKASRAIYLSHEVCHSSQYTRPAVDILRDLVEMYPVTGAQPRGRFARDGSEAELGLLSGQPGRNRRWWKRMLGIV